MWKYKHGVKEVTSSVLTSFLNRLWICGSYQVDFDVKMTGYNEVTGKTTQCSLEMQRQDFSKTSKSQLLISLIFHLHVFWKTQFDWKNVKA